MARRKLAAEMNVVPYIDVMLVLLVIFMITAPLLTQGVDVDLPDANAEPMGVDSSNEPVILSVDAAGDMYLSIGPDPEAPITRDQAIDIIQAAKRSRPDLAVVLEGDGKVDYQSIMRAMTTLQAAGIARIGFAADPELLQSRGS
ncbi:MAG: protein TolR [Abyssibacter sp.]|jgi:biopolymer transport protein TolR|nr:protein TolR [Abyssibacter sp.]MBB87572.1 protein TolR [Xanthomonadales bacterium]MCK5859110.1 protein TolR [Abyssibacter sp.]